MENFWLNRMIKYVLACMICSVALVLPYRARLLYTRLLSFLIHLPYYAFGSLAGFLLRHLNIEPVSDVDLLVPAPYSGERITEARDKTI